MNIGQAAKSTGVPAKTIRYYESIGLIAEAERRPSGYRDYGPQDIDVLRFVSRARGLGFTLKDVADLIDLWRDRNRSSAEVKALTERHIAEVDRRMAELASVRRSLAHLAALCHGDERPECPILDNLGCEEANRVKVYPETRPA